MTLRDWSANGWLKLCAILVHSSGYRPERNLQHYRLINALPLILGEDRKNDTAYLDTCRIKRNTVEYDRAGTATDGDAIELIEFAKTFRADVLSWLKTEHPALLPKRD